MDLARFGSDLALISLGFGLAWAGFGSILAWISYFSLTFTRISGHSSLLEALVALEEVPGSPRKSTVGSLL